MSTELIINASLPETRISLMENGEIQDLLIERASGKGIVGNIYKGRVTRVLPGMQAAFVDIGLEKAAFLYVDDVFVHTDSWKEEEEEDEGQPRGRRIEAAPEMDDAAPAVVAVEGQSAGSAPQVTDEETREWAEEQARDSEEDEGSGDQDRGHSGKPVIQEEEPDVEEEDEDHGHLHDEDEDGEEDDDDEGPVGMGPEDGEGGSGGNDQPPGTVGPASGGGGEGGAGETPAGGQDAAGAGGAESEASRRRHRRGRRGGRNRRGGKDREEVAGGAPRVPRPIDPNAPISELPAGDVPASFSEHIADDVEGVSDRSAMAGGGHVTAPAGDGRPEIAAGAPVAGAQGGPKGRERPEFREPRDRNRKIRARSSMRAPKPQVSIQDLLKEGQEVLVQVAKDPIATKGARLTCHISLPGRHLVCMPTIDHVGVSRRIERDEERRRLRDVVEKNRPKGLGFIVRTASGKQSSAEKRIVQDIEYLSRLWTEIREKASHVTAPAMVYEDLNSILRAIRDWVTEDIDKIVVDSRYHYNDIQRFVAHFMPSLKQKVDLYHGDVPIFDAYGISTELSRALERKVWLKSGGYLVVDQAEALVAIDVNTGRYVGKKSLEDTILKTNLEAVQEIAYQLRLRNCGGIIILDLIDMEKEENKQRVYRALEEALKKDRARPSILKISELGLVEMTRKRTRDTMVRALCDSCAHCEGKGFVKSKVTVGYEILRELEREGIERDVGKILIQAHPDVIDVLAIDERETMDQLERRYRKQIYLQAVGDFHMEQFDVSADKKQVAKSNGGELSSRDVREDRGGRGGRNRDRGGSGGSGGGREGGRDRGRGRGGSERNDRSAQGGGAGGSRNAPSRGGLPQARPLGADGMPVPGEHIGAPQPQASSGEEGGGGDEDRLAFVRAQASQDAALARNGAAEGAAPAAVPGGAPRAAGDREGGGGARRRRGRRGGKFRGRDKAPGAAGSEGSGEGSGGGDAGGGESSGGGGDAPSHTQE